MLVAAPGWPGPAASWLSFTTACGGAGPRGSSRDSTAGRSARAPSRPGGATSSAARDRPLLGVGWPPCAGPRRPPRRARLRAVGKKGTATAGAAERERVGAALVIGGRPTPPRGGAPGPAAPPPGGAALVIGGHPAQHGGGPPARAPGHLGGAAVLGDVEEGEGPLAGAGMRCAQSQVAQVLRCLTPARVINT